MKNLYILVQGKKEGKYFSYVDKVNTNNNILFLHHRYNNNIFALNVMSKKEAEKVSRSLNEIWKKGGVYAY